VGTIAAAIERKFNLALDGLIAQVKLDRAILAAVLCGSLSHDRVWQKSDIDLVLITIDDKAVPRSSLAICASGVNVHASLMPRAEFRKTAEGAIRNSFMHSLLAKGRLLYTHDETIAALCARLHEIGQRDNQVQLLSAASQAVYCADKAHKWLLTRGDLHYTALWILYAASPLARIEIIDAGGLVDREVIPQALRLNPQFFDTVYTGMLNKKKTRKSVEGALYAVDEYLADRAPRLFAPVLDHLREVGEARSATELEDHFKRNFNIEGVTMACEYLAGRKLIGNASVPVHLTRRSTVQVQELAFVHLGDAPDEF